MLSTIHAAAAQALVAFLGYQSGHARDTAASFPQDIAEAIAAHAQNRVGAAEAIKDELNKLYDRRREGHARDTAEEMKHQQHVLAARIVIERELAATPDQSLAATSLMTDEELAEISALATEPNCRDQVLAINERSAQRIMAQQPPPAEDFVHVDALAAAEEQLAAATAKTIADAEQKAVEEAAPVPLAAGEVAGGTPLHSDK